MRRLDRSDEYYYLIVFGEPHATLAVAAVNAATGDVENWARSGGHRAHLSTDASAARRLAALDESAHAELVWQPGPQTRSPLYPLWEVRGLAGRTRYVDQQGNVR